jgi:hypothetical protein
MKASVRIPPGFSLSRIWTSNLAPVPLAGAFYVKCCRAVIDSQKFTGLNCGRERLEEKMADTALKFLVRAPSIAVQKDLKHLAIIFDLVQQIPNDPQPLEKNIHLGMTMEDAMRLLAVLRSAQQQFDIPDTTAQVTLTDVPPAKDRN